MNDIKEQLEAMGLKYKKQSDKQEKMYQWYKTPDDEALLYIYLLMAEMLDKISQNLNRDVYIQFGKQIKGIVKETGVKIPEVIRDLKKINRLLEE